MPVLVTATTNQPSKRASRALAAAQQVSSEGSIVAPLWHPGARGASGFRPSSARMGGVATELAEGLWTWRREHPEWHTGSDFEPEVASYAVRLPSALLLVDPLWPEEDSEDFDWLDELARSRLLLVAVLKPDHARDGGGIAHAYGGRL